MVTVQERTIRARIMPRPTTPEEVRENDEFIENDLLILLGECEHRREEMLTACRDQQSGRVWELAEELLKEVVTYADQHLAFTASLELKAAGTKSQEFHTILNQLRQREKHVPEREVATRCLLSLQEAVLTYFSVFTRRFSSSLGARTWVDVAATFVVDMKQVTGRLTHMLVHI